MLGWSRDEAARASRSKREGARFAGQFRGEKFDGHAAAEFEVFAFKHKAHASSTEKANQSVIGNPLAKQVIGVVAGQGVGCGDRA